MRALAPVLILLLAAPAARAATGDPSREAPTAQPPTPAERARRRDASVDRGMWNANAETVGAGKWAINSYELLLLGVSYAFTDDIQASATTLLPVVEDTPVLLDLGAKVVIYRAPATVVAARARLLWITGSDGEDTLGTFSGALLVDHYLDEAGRFALHGGVQVGGFFGAFRSGDLDVADGAGFTFEAGVGLSVSDLVKLNLEGWLPALSTSGGFEFAPFGLLAYGVRFHGEGVAADLGFIYPVGKIDTGGLLLGYPFVAFSARL